jgi:hypothetical protein
MLRLEKLLRHDDGRSTMCAREKEKVLLTCLAIDSIIGIVVILRIVVIIVLGDVVVVLLHHVHVAEEP